MTSTPASSSVSQKVKTAVLVLLALWSIVSLVVIVVWCTSPDLKGAAQCREELKETTEKLEGVRVVWRKDREALERLVEGEREKGEALKEEKLLLLERLNITNSTLEQSRRTNEVLRGNVSSLQEEVQLLLQKEENLTAQIGLLEDQKEVLQLNLTEAGHQTASCFSLKAAAESQMMAAESQKKGCESRSQYLQKQLQKCNAVDAEASQQQGASMATATPSIAPALTARSPIVALLLCAALILAT
ncbi:uncharacterized protein KZ484_006910 isoform 1-T1 [Pholidichthys leucotaenia]